MEKPREWLREKSIAKKVLSDADVIFEIVDARIPFETRNSVIEQLAKERNKKLVIVMNKADLVPQWFARKVKKIIEKEFPVVLFSSHKNIGKREIDNLIKELSHKKKIIKIGVLGYPNVGKSSFINALKRKRVATTSPKPGMTRGEKLIKLYRNVYLIDTPGIITLEYQSDLALKCSWIPDKLEQPVEVAQKLIDRILRERPEALEETYGIEPDEEPLKTLEKIGKKLNYVISGGKIDLERAARKVLWDWIKGKIKAYWI
ncbi:GTPase RsgA [Persephonella atlantica]|uniref:Ribosome biogenesis GTPase A n=1 Tax=Persephonella atlantica TaxID=2699429 RepID=A0ABS1GJG7_9AQUI|nr:GTPase [Persephonella atlantica]MBK3333026.1 GTPase RsgA [Persephonella atlantica]